MANFLNPSTWFAARTARPEVKEDRADDPAKQLKDTALGYSNMLWLNGGFDQMVNPDQLIRLKGAGVYNRMLADDEVSASFNLKLNLIISRNFRFSCTGEDQEEITDFFYRSTSDLIQGTWMSALRSILMGKAYGFSVSEKVYRSGVVDTKPRWILDRINLKPYDSIRFTADEYGNLIGLNQADVDSYTTRALDIDKFIIYVNKPEIDPIWGQSDLKPAYIPYWEKDITRKYWNIHIERVAGGFPVITPNERAGNLEGSNRTNLENTVKNVTGLSGIVLPQGFDCEIIQADETQAFISKIEHHDKQIARAILIPNLLGFSEQGSVGSYSQSQTQFEIFMMLIKEDCDYLADVLNEQLFSQLAWWNFKVSDYPRFEFEEFTASQKREIAKVWAEAASTQIVTNTVQDEIRTREYVGYPKLDEETIEDARAKTKPEEIDKPEPIMEPVAKEPGKADDDSTDKEADADTPTSAETKQSNSERGNAIVHGTAADVSTIHHEEGETIEFTDRIDFNATEDQLDGIESMFTLSLSDGVDNVQEELVDAIKAAAKELPEDKAKIDYEDLKKQLEKGISTKTKSNMKKGILNSLRATYNTGWTVGHKAVLKAAKDTDAPKAFINKINSIALMSERKVCTEEEWSIISFIEGLSLEAASAWFNSQSFYITGAVSNDMLNSAINIMTNGINNDWSTTAMVDEFMAGNESLTGGTDKQERSRLNTVVRTNMSTIFTQAQLAFYNDPALGGFVEALSYSAILDRRTTPICNRLNGSVYPMNDPIWRFITPPNHFQCRSVLIPVTVLDKWNRDSGGFSERQLPGEGFGRTGLAGMFNL